MILKRITQFTTLILTIPFLSCVNGKLASSGSNLGGSSSGKPFNLAGSFDGTSATQVTIGTPSFTFNSSITVEAFFVTSSMAATQHILYYNMPGGTRFSISVLAGVLQAGVPDGCGAPELTLSSVVNVADGLKHHVAVEYNMTTKMAYLYLDGVMVASQIGTITLTSCTATAQNIGGFVGSNCFLGTIDEIRFSRTNRYGGMGASFTKPTGAFFSDSYDYLIHDFDTNSTSGIVYYSSPGGISYSGTSLQYVVSPFP